MNKGDLVSKIYEKLEGKFTKIDISSVLDSVISSIMDGVKEDGSVQLVGFGSFVAKKRPARNGHHPKTGAKIKIPAMTSVSFKVGKSFKDTVKNTK